MRIIVITPEQTGAEEVENVNEMFANGLERLHLRKPAYDEKEYIKLIQQVDYQYHYRIILHSSFQLVERFRLGGIHLNSHFQKDKEAMQFAQSMVGKVSVSASFHSWEEIYVNQFPYDYVFISPVYDSISKPDYKAAVDLKAAKELKQKLQIESRYCPQIVALGGVGANHLRELYEYGFDGVAVLGSIWESDDPIKQFLEIRRVLNSLSI